MIKKEEFIFLMESIKEQMNSNSKIEKSMDAVFEDFFGIAKSPLIDKVVKFLTDSMNDECEYIDYFIYELSFGEELSYYENGSPLKDKDDKEIPFKTLEDVYNCIVTLN